MNIITILQPSDFNVILHGYFLQYKKIQKEKSPRTASSKEDRMTSSLDQGKQKQNPFIHVLDISNFYI